MISRQTKTIDYIKIGFDKNFVRSLTLLSKRKIEPITIRLGDEDIIIGIKCPVVMDEDTFDQDRKTIESDILKSFADILNSEACNRKRDDKLWQYKYSWSWSRKTGVGLKANRSTYNRGNSNGHFNNPERRSHQNSIYQRYQRES